MQTVLSIIIPVYNVEKYIKMTLDSIFSQVYKREDIEVVVVNDGTPDRSMDIVAQFAIRNSNLRIINQENQGLSGARNTGIREARGKYIWFVDSDDTIEEGILCKIIPLLRDGSKDVYSFKIREYDEKGAVLKERDFLDNYQQVSCDGLEMIKLTARYHILHTPMQMHVINAKFLRDNDLLFTPGIYHEDMEFAPRMLLAAQNVSYVPWVTYRYIKRESGSITTNPNLLEKRLKSLMKIADVHIEIMKGLSGKEQLIFSFAVYRVIAYIHALIPKKDYNRWCSVLDIHSHRKEFIRIVLMNLNYDRNWTRLPRQICYILFPQTLKLLGLGI